MFSPKNYIHFWTLLLCLKVGGNASSKASAPVKIDESSAEGKDSNSSSSAELATEESISEFLTQVTTLVK